MSEDPPLKRRSPIKLGSRFFAYSTLAVAAAVAAWSHFAANRDSPTYSPAQLVKVAHAQDDGLLGILKDYNLGSEGALREKLNNCAECESDLSELVQSMEVQGVPIDPALPNLNEQVKNSLLQYRNPEAVRRLMDLTDALRDHGIFVDPYTGDLGEQVAQGLGGLQPVEVQPLPEETLEEDCKGIGRQYAEAMQRARQIKDGYKDAGCVKSPLAKSSTPASGPQTPEATVDWPGKGEGPTKASAQIDATEIDRCYSFVEAVIKGDTRVVYNDIIDAAFKDTTLILKGEKSVARIINEADEARKKCEPYALPISVKSSKQLYLAVCQALGSTENVPPGVLRRGATDFEKMIETILEGDFTLTIKYCTGGKP